MLGGMRRINGGGRRNISITHVPILPEIGLGYKSGVWLSPGSHVTACEAGAVPKPPLAPHESCINGGAALLTLDEDDAKSRHERWPTPGLGSIPAQEIQPPKILPSQVSPRSEWQAARKKAYFSTRLLVSSTNFCNHSISLDRVSETVAHAGERSS
jgi:hypothetical protein